MNRSIQKNSVPPELRYLDQVTRLMDSAIRIPGTNIRLCLDSVIGFVPGIGDAVSLFISGGIVLALIRHGASTKLVLRMMANLAIDAIGGYIPILGDLFDIGFKANRRNFHLLLNHYASGGRRNPIWVSILVIVLFVLGLIISMVALTLWLLSGLFQ